MWHTPTTATTALQWVIPRCTTISARASWNDPSADWYGGRVPWNLAHLCGRPRQDRANVRPLRGAPGRRGIRPGSVPDQRAQFVEYERVVDETVQTANVLALCTYPAAGWSPPDMLNVLMNHQAVLLPDQRGGGKSTCAASSGNPLAIFDLR